MKSVTEWLTKSGIPAESITLSKSKGWLNFETTAGEFEAVVKTKFHTYSSAKTGGIYFGADEYSLPKDIAPLVDLILPGISFSEMQERRKPTRSHVRPVSKIAQKNKGKQEFRASSARTFS